MAPAIMIAVAASGNNNLLSYIVTSDHGESGSSYLIAGKFDARPVPVLGDSTQSYFFSITHCKGCWFFRAKSITWVTLVSAIS